MIQVEGVVSSFQKDVSWQWIVVTQTTNGTKPYHTKGLFFVARLKSNATTRVIERRAVDRSTGLTNDQRIEFTGVMTLKRCPIPMRRVGYQDSETGKRYTFPTTNFSLATRTIAAICRSRWQIELFF